MQGELSIGGKKFKSRLFVGTGKFSSAEVLKKAVRASASELVTMSVKRVHLHGERDEILTPLKELGVALLPNTAGARNAKEAVYAAQIARECLGTSLIKLEVHPDQRYLLPDPIETLNATKELVADGFTVMPYCQADPVLAKRLADAGAACVMPLAAPIGSNRGLLMKEMIRIIIEQSDRLKNLVNRLLGPQHAEKRQFSSVHEILEKVLKLTAISLPDNIKIKRDYDPSLPDVYIAPEQIYQVFLNIVKNAVEAIGQREDGLITLKTRAAFKVNIRGSVQRLMVEVHVTDNGPGIPDDIKDTVFYPMVSRKEGGHGLGLAIAQTIIDEHSGKIECVSWSGHTDFIISLPVEKTPQDVA